MINIGFLPAPVSHEAHLAVAEVASLPGPSGLAAPLPTSRLRPCPKCDELALIRIENCDQCTSCGYSKCG